MPHCADQALDISGTFSVFRSAYDTPSDLKRRLDLAASTVAALS